MPIDHRAQRRKSRCQHRQNTPRPGKGSPSPRTLALGILAALLTLAAAGAGATDATVVTWQCLDVLKPYETVESIPWTDIGFRITTDTGEIVTGHLSATGAPLPLPVGAATRSFGSLKAGFSGVRSKGLQSESSTSQEAVLDGLPGDASSMTLELYNDRDHDDIPDPWNASTPGYLHYTKPDIAIIPGTTNDLGEILMITDAASDNPQPTYGVYEIRGSRNNTIDLKIEHVTADRGANTTVGDYFGYMGLKHINSNGVQTHWVNQNENPTFISEQVQVDRVWNSSTSSYEWTGLEDAIITQTYNPANGDPPSDDDNWEILFLPNTDGRVSGQLGGYSTSQREIYINEEIGSLGRIKAGILEKWGAYQTTGNKSLSVGFDFGTGEVIIPETQREMLRFEQLLAREGITQLPQYSGNYLDMEQYSIDP